MNKSNKNNAADPDQSSTQSADDNSTTDQPDSKYILGECSIDHIGESLQTAADYVDGPLTVNSYKQWREQQTSSHASVNQIVMHSDRGETWGEICSSYGILTSHSSMYNKQAVIDALQCAANTVGEPLSNSAYDEWQQAQNKNYPTPYLIWSNFDKNWRELCNEAGVQPCRSKSYTPNDIRTALQQAAVELGEPLVLADYQSWARNQPDDRPSSKTITRYFEDWQTACIESDVEPHQLAQHTRSSPYSSDDIITAIQAAAEAKSEPLSPDAYEAWRQSHADYPSKRTCLRRFTSWKAACEAAEVTAAGISSPDEYTDEELLAALNRASASVDGTITLSQYKTWRSNQQSIQPSPATIRQRFGGWVAARSELPLPTRSR